MEDHYGRATCERGPPKGVREGQQPRKGMSDPARPCETLHNPMGISDVALQPNGARPNGVHPKEALRDIAQADMTLRGHAQLNAGRPCAQGNGRENLRTSTPTRPAHCAKSMRTEKERLQRSVRIFIPKGNRQFGLRGSVSGNE